MDYRFTATFKIRICVEARCTDGPARLEKDTVLPCLPPEGSVIDADDSPGEGLILRLEPGRYTYYFTEGEPDAVLLVIRHAYPGPLSDLRGFAQECDWSFHQHSTPTQGD